MHSLHWIDYAIMLIYFAFVLGIGYALKRYVKTSTDFFLSGRSIPAWARPCDRAIEKQPAWAAAISSSGLVPWPDSKREANEYGPW